MKDLMENVIEVERKISRIMKIKIVIGRKTGHIIAVYVHVGRTEEKRRLSWVCWMMK